MEIGREVNPHMSTAELYRNRIGYVCIGDSVCFPPEPIDWTPRDAGPPWIQALASWTLDETP